MNTLNRKWFFFGLILLLGMSIQCREAEVTTLEGEILEVPDESPDDGDSPGDKSSEVAHVGQIYVYALPKKNGDLGGRWGIQDACFKKKPTNLEPIEGYRYLVHGFITIDDDDSIANMPKNYFFDPLLPIQTVDGEVIANNWADLLNGPSVSLYDSGILPEKYGYFWTGSEKDGTAPESNENNYGDQCFGFELGAGEILGNGNGVVGLADYTDESWLDKLAPFCDDEAYVICVAFPAEGEED